ncbi:Dynein light chain 4, axonemal [Orchesella cincta]|uniref:Dynein light chain n=1 Tax=Orchesella cincta TaxID=48709 RepID=A0A1D2N6P2_ORCCI|nr:Dynein light chain 4, axonemal [Orchesella cincta]
MQAAAQPQAEAEQETEKKAIAAYPIVRYTDVPEETKADIVDTITGAVERFGADYDLAAKLIKEDMDRTYGPHWHAVVGESFGYEVTHQNNHIMYMFFLGNLGILVWKNC